MKRTNLEYTAEAVKGKIYARAEGNRNDSVTAVSIDSRDVPAECLFFAIIGERADAHRFLPDVYEKGCRNVVVSDSEWAEKMGAKKDVNVILVPDTRLALMDLGEKYLDDWSGLRKVGVTGSVGKTSTKEFLYSVLRSRYRTGKTPGNLNSEFGIPLTAFSFAEDIQVAVIEMGAGYGSAMGDLSRIAKPEAAVITNVGTSHLEVYGTREKLLEEKLRVSTGFTPENTLVINTDSDILTKENAQRHQPSDARIVTVGSKGGEDYHLSDIRDRGIEGVQCDVTHGDETVTLKLPVIGAHNLGNAVLAMAIGEVFGITMEESVEALREVETNANRLSVVKGTDYSVINDTYNGGIYRCCFYAAANSCRASLCHQYIFSDSCTDNIDCNNLTEVTFHVMNRFHDHKLIADQLFVFSCGNNASYYLANYHVNLQIYVSTAMQHLYCQIPHG